MQLWAITSYFNPAGFRRRLQNYRVFRSRLSVPLLTVEWAPAGNFVLKPGDADVLVRVQGGDIMWQKERLLNVALGALPADCGAVAWLDCDLILGAEDWSERAVRALERSPLVQLFERQHNLQAGTDVDRIPDPSIEPVAHSVAAKIVAGEVIARVQSIHNMPKDRACWGGAWAAQRDLLGKHGFYDACIAGGGDEAMVCAAIGQFERVMTSIKMDEPRRNHYLAWAERFHADVCGSVDWISGPFYHLWHGEVEHRRYRERHEDMAAFGFDPARDIAVSEEGPWRWNSTKEDLHDYLAGYFRQRREDG